MGGEILLFCGENLLSLQFFSAKLAAERLFVLCCVVLLLMTKGQQKKRRKIKSVNTAGGNGGKCIA